MNRRLALIAVSVLGSAFVAMMLHAASVAIDDKVSFAVCFALTFWSNVVLMTVLILEKRL